LKAQEKLWTLRNPAFFARRAKIARILSNWAAHASPTRPSFPTSSKILTKDDAS
jgi:hypothetical protein